MGIMKRWATARMFGKDAENFTLYGPTRKPKKEPKPPKTPKEKKVKVQKQLPLEGETNVPESQC